MSRKITSLFILFAFLLLKSTSLFAFETKQNHTICCEADQDAEQSPVDDKTDKSQEFADEDFLTGCPVFLVSPECIKEINIYQERPLIALPVSLPNPPPDVLVFPGV